MSRVTSTDEIQICEEVGRGGFGVVYRGVLLKSGQDVAIKEIDLESEVTDIYEVNQEIQILSECLLPYITSYLGCLVKELKLWVVMEFVDGGLLYDLLQDGPINDYNVVGNIAREILLALDYLHCRGKIHRDLKSQNVLLTRDGHAKLTDFGVSTQLFSTFSRRNTTVGTPYWMSPEVIVDISGGHNHEADIWSLGCCVFELCTGKPPLQEQYSPMQALRTISGYKTESDFWNAISLELVNMLSPNSLDFLQQCMVIDPTKRPSAATLLKHRFISQVNIKSAESALRNLVALKTPPPSDKYHTTNEPYLKHSPEKKERTKDIKTIQFDFSTIKINNSAIEVFTPPNLRQVLDQSESPFQPYTPRGYSNRRIQSMKTEYQILLDKCLYKMNERTKLLAQQHEELVRLNKQMLDLFVSVPSSENVHSKLLIGQYLKLIFKELGKKSFDVSRNQLSRSFLPSYVLNNMDIKSTSKPGTTPMDDVEQSLLSSWIDNMKRCG